MAYSDITNLEVRDRVLPLANDTTNWGTTEIDRRWARGVEYVQGQLLPYISKTVLDTFNTEAGITALFKILYGGAAAAEVWGDLRGFPEKEKLANASYWREYVDAIIEKIVSGGRKVYDASGDEITVANIGADNFHFTQDGVEPVFRRGRYDVNGNLLDDEAGSLDTW